MGKSKNKSKKLAKQMSTLKIKGRGDYEVARPATTGVLAKLDKVLSRLPKGSFATGGAAIGAKFGGARGAEFGRKMGAGLSAISGYGDYNVRSNSLGTVSTSVDMVPQFVKNDHSVRVVHREYIADLKVPGNPSNFTNTDYLINPANATLFPWLARMAKQYSQYRIHGMVFSFKSMSSEYADAGPLGTVILATNYNAVDRPYANKLEMENSEFAVSTKPSQSLIHAIECDPSVTGLNVLYVRDPAYDTTDTSDRRFYDYGRFQVATQGLPGSTGATMGELWVSYDIEFMKPIIGGDVVTGPCATITGQFDGQSAVVPNSNPTGRVPTLDITCDAIAPSPGTTYSVAGVLAGTSGDIGLSPGVLSYLNGNVILRKNGNYRITWQIQGNTTATKYVLADGAVAGNTAGSTNANGTAVVTTLGLAGLVPHIVTSAAATSGFRSTQYQDFVVRGIADGTGAVNNVVIVPPSFLTTANATAIIGSITRFIRIEWLQTGQNGQSTVFTPSA